MSVVPFHKKYTITIRNVNEALGGEGKGSTFWIVIRLI